MECLPDPGGRSFQRLTRLGGRTQLWWGKVRGPRRSTNYAHRVGPCLAEEPRVNAHCSRIPQLGVTVAARGAQGASVRATRHGQVVVATARRHRSSPPPDTRRPPAAGWGIDNDQISEAIAATKRELRARLPDYAEVLAEVAAHTRAPRSRTFSAPATGRFPGSASRPLPLAGSGQPRWLPYAAEAWSSSGTCSPPSRRRPGTTSSATRSPATASTSNVTARSSTSTSATSGRGSRRSSASTGHVRRSRPASRRP